MQPFISIIIVTYNAAKFLQQSLDSVASQDYKNIELIVIDGKSTDETVQIIENNTSKIKYWVSETDNGIYDAMNKGVKVASGDYILFLGADDVLHNVLHQVAEKLVDSNCVYYGNVFFESIQKEYDGEFNAYKLAVKNICHQAIFYPKSVFLKYKFNTKYKIRADHYLNLECFSDKNFRFQYMNINIANYSDGGFSSLGHDVEFNNDRLNFIKSHFGIMVYAYCFTRSFVSKYILSKKYHN
jgi:glycosyltransferase involved in cell wall biosynthesis